MDGSVGSWDSYSPRGSNGEWAPRPPTPRERVQQQIVLNQAKRLRRLQQVWRAPPALEFYPLMVHHTRVCEGPSRSCSQLFAKRIAQLNMPNRMLGKG